MTDKVKFAPRHCRLLASGGWLATGYVFLWGAAGAWGEIPPGFMLWTIAAAPLGLLTHRWLVRLGYEIPTLACLVLWTLWLGLCIVMFATARPRTPDAVQIVPALVAAAVTLFGVVTGAIAETSGACDGAR